MSENDLRDILLRQKLSLQHIQCCKDSFMLSRPVYHNEEHCFSTAVTFFELGEGSGLSWRQLNTGVLAAIYHDANHQNTPRDDDNIPAAVSWFLHESPEEPYITKSEVSKLIKSTHQANRLFASFSEELLHDADILQTVKSNEQVNQQWRDKLSKELHTPIEAVSSLDFVSSKLLTAPAKALLAVNSHRLPRRFLADQKV